MRSRTLLWLLAVTVAAGLLAWWSQREPRPREADAMLLPALAGQLNEVSALVLEPAGSEAFRIERDDAGWRAPAAAGYPVDAGQVRRLVVRLAEARVVETKTSNPELHDRLGVEELDGRPGSGVRLRLEGIDDIAELLIGQRESRGVRGTYVRRIGEPTALLVDQDLQPERAPLNWLEREILDVSPEEVEALSIVQPDGETLAIHRDELGIFQVVGVPEDRRISGPTAAEAVARALSGLRLDEVRPAVDWAPEESPTRAAFRLRDGLVIEAHSWIGGDEPWVAFSARIATESPPADQDLDALWTRMQAINERLAPWLYRVPAWKQEQFTRRLEDLLAPAGD